MVQNPNDCAAANATVRATLFDGEGNELGSYDGTLALVGAGETVGFTGEAGDGLAPARVEFTIDPDSVTWKDGVAATAPYIVKSFDEQDKLYFRYEIDGTIANVTDSYGSGANLHTGSAYRIKAGQTKNFLITLHSAPDHASTKVFMQPT